jgi:hypothetical protein
MAKQPSEGLSTADNAWITFPGGELEGRRPKRLCPECRAKQESAPERPGGAVRSRSLTLCFQCYRLDLDRQRALRAAGQLDTASEARFQFALPLEPLDLARLSTLRASRAAARVSAQSGSDRFADRRRHAQIAARHALQSAADRVQTSNASYANHVAGLSHVAELQLPESWLSFVIAAR